MADFSTTTEVKYPDGTVQTTTTTMAAKSKWAPWHDDNIILLTDSYKLTHYKQYPPGTETVYSYFESRGSGEDLKNIKDMCFFGLQYFLKRYLVGPVRNPRSPSQPLHQKATAHFSVRPRCFAGGRAHPPPPPRPAGGDGGEDRAGQGVHGGAHGQC